jgi:hypothetical protein
LALVKGKGSGLFHDTTLTGCRQGNVSLHPIRLACKKDWDKCIEFFFTTLPDSPIAS